MDNAKNFMKGLERNGLWSSFTDHIHWGLNVMASSFNAERILLLISVCLFLIFKVQQDASLRIK
jgi:hypothetical protein